MVANIFNPSILEAEANRSLSLGPAWATQRNPVLNKQEREGGREGGGRRRRRRRRRRRKRRRRRRRRRAGEMAQWVRAPNCSSEGPEFRS